MAKASRHVLVTCEEIIDSDEIRRDPSLTTIPYIYVDTSHIKNRRGMLQGDKIETPQYVRDNNLLPDYEFYITNQILKPVSQIFGLCLEDLRGFTKVKVSLCNLYYIFGNSITKSPKSNIKKSKFKANIESCPPDMFWDCVGSLDSAI